MPYARGARGVEIHYRVAGSGGPFVVLLHGIGLSGRFWFELPQRLAGDGARRVLVVDSRGTGHSACPSRPWGMADMADDVAAVLDAAGAGDAVVAGLSMGGMIAQHVALRHPDRVRGLLLMATSAGMLHGRLTSPRAIWGLVSLPFIDESKVGRRLARLLLPPGEVARGAELLQGWREVLQTEAASRRAFLLQLAAVSGHATWARLGEIRCPTVVLTGDQDVLMPPANSRVLAERIPGARLEVLEGVGHGIDLLAPDAVIGAIERLADPAAGFGASAGA